MGAAGYAPSATSPCTCSKRAAPGRSAPNSSPNFRECRNGDRPGTGVGSCGPANSPGWEPDTPAQYPKGSPPTDGGRGRNLFRSRPLPHSRQLRGGEHCRRFGPVVSALDQDSGILRHARLPVSVAGLRRRLVLMDHLACNEGVTSSGGGGRRPATGGRPRGIEYSFRSRGQTPRLVRSRSCGLRPSGIKRSESRCIAAFQESLDGRSELLPSLGGKI
jgi:hypothetical protein